MRRSHLAWLAAACVACAACGGVDIKPPPFESKPHTFAADPQFPAGLGGRAEPVPALRAAARVLAAAAWQAQLVPEHSFAPDVAVLARRASSALDREDLASALAALEAITEMVASDPPASAAPYWANVRAAVAAATTLLARPELEVVYAGGIYDDGGRIALTIGGERLDLEFTDSGAPELKPDEENKIRWRRPWVNRRWPRAVLDGQCGKMLDLALADDSGSYVGLSVRIRYFYAAADCKRLTWIQLVKRTTTIDGNPSPAHSKRWSIDVVPPADVKPEDADNWKKAHPGYQRQVDAPTGEEGARGKELRDDPGVPIPAGSGRVVTTYQFKSFVICCDPFSVIARVEWGFTLQAGRGEATQVDELTRDPEDANREFPNVTAGGADDPTLTELLGDWIADPARDCR